MQESGVPPHYLSVLDLIRIQFLRSLVSPFLTTLALTTFPSSQTARRERMGIDQLIDQTFPSLPPHPHRGSTSSTSYSTSNIPLTPPRVQRPASSYSGYGVSERGSMSIKDQDGRREREREASTSRIGMSRDSIYARGQQSISIRSTCNVSS